MKRIPPIRHYMTPFPWHIGLQASVQEAQSLMEQQGIHHLPVLEGEQVVGLLCVPLGEGSLAEQMQPICCLEDSERADQVLDRMVAEHLRVVVLIHHQRIAGIFTWRDACQHFAALLREPFLPPQGNGAA